MLKAIEPREGKRADNGIPSFPLKGTFLPKFVDWAAKTTDAPLQFLAGGALISMSAAVGRNIVLNNRIFSNLWLSLMGESTLLRKSTSVSLARTLCEKAGVGTFPDRLTPESFYESMAKYPQGLFALSELGGWLGSLNRSYSIGFKQDITELYDCPVEFRRTRKDSKGRVIEFKIIHPYICILGASTIEWFETHVRDDDSSGGFLPRFQFILGTPREPYPVPPKLVVPDELVTYLKLLTKTRGSVVLESGKAYNTYAEWFHSFREKIKKSPAELIPYGIRIETVALKLALLFEADKNPGEIISSLSKDAILIGCEYADCFFESARLVIERLGFSNFERLCQRVLRVIENNPGATQRDILRTICIPKTMFADAIAYLTDSGKIASARSAHGRGRPTVKYYLI
ncbi:hypothetical protein IT084_02655 [Desulfallas sp. Bu1-1]|uniref:hypothetical protein n=1 Tax=Desulfallas sp. Bu1-1 TaxID=2787620 RepID=UPI00189DBFB1|nr:hypothetical protein [Desulfallas sp. Bu1-1]MBF7081875.1 hypothetical protein [Desulfallas sp. Bu1-1]